MAVPRLEFMVVTPEMAAGLNPFNQRPPSNDPDGPFRIGELSRLSGVAIGTIKYYLREGLVPQGRATAKTQALYSTEHLRRLRLVRVLADVGGLSIAQIKEVTSAIDHDEQAEPGELAQLASYSIGSKARAAREAAAEQAGDALTEARQATDAFIDTLGFVVDQSSPARAELAEALHALRVLGIAQDPIVFYEHARHAYELGSFEIASARPTSGEPSRAVESIMVGSVIFGAAFLAIRRMAHEHEGRRAVYEASTVKDAPPA
jgi:DNA-binding transcriptional MerR regulator